MNANVEENLYYREGILPRMPVFPENVEVYRTTDVHSLARSLIRYTEILKGDPNNVAELIHGGRRGPRVHHPVALDTLWHFATVGPQAIANRKRDAKTPAESGYRGVMDMAQSIRSRTG